MPSKRTSNHLKSNLGRSLINSKSQNNIVNHRNLFQNNSLTNVTAAYSESFQSPNSLSSQSNLKSIVEETTQLDTYIATTLASQKSFSSLKGKYRFLSDSQPIRLNDLSKTQITISDIRIPRRPSYFLNSKKNELNIDLHDSSNLTNFNNSFENNFDLNKSVFSDVLNNTSDISKNDSNITKKLPLVNLENSNISNSYKKNNKEAILSSFELENLELESFLEWRRFLASLEEKNLTLTPYEKNIEVWKQLWRVLEKSDIILEILDARNPLLFHVPDIIDYTKTINIDKDVIILINKSDFLTNEMRKNWLNYFTSLGLKVIFFSAIRELFYQGAIEPKHYAHLSYQSEEEFFKFLPQLDKEISLDISQNSCQILDCKSLLNLLEKQQFDKINSQISDSTKNFINKYSEITIGLVGYPNVGKSSIINSLFGSKKVSISRQPGKTKHFQTLRIPGTNITLCDCPGLVFPTIVSNRYHLLINGITSIDYFSGDYIPAIQIICNELAEEICKKYKLLDKNLLNHSQSYSNTHSITMDATRFLNELANSRHFYSGGKGGQLDLFRAASVVIKDYISGRLLYNHLPPNQNLQQSSHINKFKAIDSNILHDSNQFPKKDDSLLSEKAAEKIILETTISQNSKMTKRSLRKIEKAAAKGGAISIDQIISKST